jgi:hypothetical protein
MPAAFADHALRPARINWANQAPVDHAVGDASVARMEQTDAS